MNINEAWNSTCKIVLGGEIGELDQYKNYLLKHVEAPESRKSCLSGKEVFTSSDRYAKNSKFISSDEASSYLAKSQNTKLGLDKISDIDSIIGAFKEQFAYSGNIILGNSGNIARSHRCINVFFAQDANGLSDSKFAAYSSTGRFADYCFGSYFLGEDSHLIKVMHAFRAKRSFECTRIFDSSDSYFCANLEGCQHCIFSFNQRNKLHLIGNVQLGKEAYQKKKEELLAQIRDELTAKKNIAGIIELLGKGEYLPAPAPSALYHEGKQKYYPSAAKPGKELEESFSSTTGLLFGKALSSLADYENWLLQNVRPNILAKSALSGKPVFASPTLFYKSLQNSLLLLSEAMEKGKESISEKELAELSLQNAAKALSKIAFSSPEVFWGESAGMEECVNYGYSQNCFRSSTCYWSKNCAYNNWTRDDESCFGTDLVFYSKFCLKCYHSNSLTRCFEVSDSFSSSDCYFCHNVENCQECMFCFNMKSKRYAIGNVEYPKEDYLRIKKLVLHGLVDKLEKTKSIPYDIFNLS